MSSVALFGYLFAAAAGGGGVVALRERPRQAAVVGLLGTTVCLMAAVLMAEDASLTIGATTLEVTAYGRLFLIGAALALLVSQIAGLAHGWQRELPLATLGALGLVGVALTVGTPTAAMLTVAAASTFVVIASLERAISMPAVRAVASGLRLAAIAGFMAVVAMAITRDDPIFVAPDVLAGATLLMAAAVALRIGAVPLHAPVARLIERARTAALPLLSAWVPAAFAVVALTWTETLVVLGATTPISLAVVAVGVITIALASVVVLVDDDLIRLLGYGVIADGGFVLLALGGDDVGSIAAGLAWLVCFALARTLMACVFLGFQGAYDARRTRELDGWLRRTPLLGVALLASLLLAYGLPGTIPWQTRLALAQNALGETVGLGLVLIALLPLLALARLAWTGVQPIGAAVADGRSERFRRPGIEVESVAAVGAGVDDGTAVATEAGRAMAEAVEPTPGRPEGRPDQAPETTIGASDSPTDRAPVTDTPMAFATDEVTPATGPEDAGTGAPSRPTSQVTGSALARQGQAVRAARARRQPTTSAPLPDDQIVPTPTGATPSAATEAPPSSSPAAATGAGEPAPRTSGSSPATPESMPATPEPALPTPEPAPQTRSRRRSGRGAIAASEPTSTTEAPSETALPAAAEAAAATDEGEEPAAVPETAAAPPPAGDGASRTSTARRFGASTVAGARQSGAKLGGAGASAWAGLRRASSSASSRSGPVASFVRDLPAIWALDRTLIASLAMLVLAVVAVAFAFDLVGLAAAADLGTTVAPAAP